MIRGIRRLRSRWRLAAMLDKEFRRRVQVEEELMLRASGAKPLPNAEDCRRMAVKLGVPEDWKR